MDKLYIVIPAYNEEENIEAVAREWHEVVTKVGETSKLVIIDDGGKDSTYQILEKLQNELTQLVPIKKKNSGHGATVQYAYNYALSQQADYIFQTDSDGQTIPEEFYEFWAKRKEHDVIIGFRKNRKDGFSRIFVTKTLRIVLFCIFRLWIIDANTPFRLMKSDVLEKYMSRIPEGYNLTNVLLSVVFKKYNENIIFIPITFRERQGGVNSIDFKKIIKIGKVATNDFMKLRKSI